MSCELCEYRTVHGRADRDPVHCRHCHLTWRGIEAQHCVRCHHTFSSISSADSHRYRALAPRRYEDRCIDPAVTDGWREIRENVWTNATEWNGPK